MTEAIEQTGHKHCEKCRGCMVQGVWHNCYNPFDVDPQILQIFVEAARRKSSN